MPRTARNPAFARQIDERTSGRDDHCTPLWFIKRIAAFSRRDKSRPRPIGLDPAGAMSAPINGYVQRRYVPARGENALELSWTMFGLVFCNPPYGTEIRKWAQKAVDEFGGECQCNRVDELLMFTAARVDTRWFKLMWQHASAVLFFHKRFTFVGETDPAKFPQALLYFGHDASRFVRHFGDLGLIIASPDKPITRAALLSRVAYLTFPGIMSVRIAKPKIKTLRITADADVVCATGHLHTSIVAAAACDRSVQQENQKWPTRKKTTRSTRKTLRRKRATSRRSRS